MNTRTRTSRTPKQLEAFARMNAGRTNLARARKVLTRDELFFYEHAGYSYDPQTESANDGRMRCAREMAKAEQFVRGQEYEYEWAWDEEPELSWMTDEEREQEHEVLSCRLFNPREENRISKSPSCAMYATLAAVGGIVDADSNYRRVIEAELAVEAMYAYDEETEVLDAH